MTILVHEVMSKHLVTLAADETVSLAEQLMTAMDARHLPVLADGGHLVGLVSDRDLLAAAASTLADADARAQRQRVPVDEIMSRDLRVVEPTTRLLDAALMMRTFKIGCLPVVEDGTLVGIVTESDLLDVLISALQTEGTPPDAAPPVG